ncbi:unnamed protein product [Cylindrotheca closterium]|uniref:Aminoglycoside phosphotransferase domain-containing protein n=1 Tax=Cylindrotheca closterium TaxID=2856 RepID=A0AAD2FHR1_9STRA|nr:unnamed protein product [Cylindrotheca closterium]
MNESKTLSLAIKKIIPYCNENSDHALLRKIGFALKSEKDELKGASLEGSTNYSFKIYLESDPSVALFAKVAFSYALWNPNREVKFGVERETMEFNMMRRFAESIGESAPVAKPYLCIDIDTSTRMLVCEFIESRLLANQFVEGTVDRRVLPKIASFVAELNLQSMNDPSLNEGIKDSYRSLYPTSKEAFGAMVNSKEENDDDHFLAYAKKVGTSRFSDIIDAMGREYEKSECLLHGDMHSLNILVEPFTENGFGEKGSFVLCDWEMAHAGVKGRDAGSFYAWPILSAFFLIGRGRRKEADDVLDCILQFWNEYERTLVKVGGAQKGAMPFHLVSEFAREKIWASVGLTGLRCLEYAFMKEEPHSTIEELQSWFGSLVSDQVELLCKVIKD